MSYYRKNKFGESIEVGKYECGSCRNYEFERDNTDNYCNQYCHYYHYKEHCNNYWEMSSDVDGGSGCFFTTACCKYMGLPDDCNELQCLRAFRDNYLLKYDYGYSLVQEYYKIAPGIVKKIDVSEKREQIYKSIYNKIKVIEQLIVEDYKDKAVDEYVQMVLKIQKMVDDAE